MAGNGRITNLEASGDQCAANGGRFNFRVSHGLNQTFLVLGGQDSHQDFDAAKWPFARLVFFLDVIEQAHIFPFLSWCCSAYFIRRLMSVIGVGLKRRGFGGRRGYPLPINEFPTYADARMQMTGNHSCVTTGRVSLARPNN